MSYTSRLGLRGLRLQKHTLSFSAADEADFLLGGFFVAGMCPPFETVTLHLAQYKVDDVSVFGEREREVGNVGI